MRCKTNLLALFLLSTATLIAQNPGDSVFAGIKVHTISIDFNQPNYWDSLVYYYELGDGQYMVGTVTLNGETLDSCGVRLKGNSSYSHPNNKKSFKIKFDKYRDDQRWDELKSIHLNNCYGDPTLMREKLHLDFCRDIGVAAPRANYGDLFINDTLFAFYSMVESVDKKFLNTRYDDNDGDLFKAIDGFENSQIISDFVWYTSVPDSYYNRYELKTEDSQTAWSNLIMLLDTLHHCIDINTALEAEMNLNSFFSAVAADILFANLDAYNNTGRNFYIYFLPTTDLMEWIVWDVGLSFGGYGGGVSNFENLNLNYLISSTQRPLLGKIYESDQLKNDYLYNLCELFNTYFSDDVLFPQIDSIANIIRPFVYADPKKMYTNNQFEVNLLTDLNIGGVGGGNRIPGLKSFISLREVSVQTQLTNLGINCTNPVEEETKIVPEYFKLEQNYPNPFNPLTVIKFQIPEQSYIQIKVYDILGNEIASMVNETLNAGNHSIEFNAEKFSSGIYFYSLIAGKYNQTKKMILIK